MFCKWCGLESESSDFCSWCEKPLGSTAKVATVEPVAERSVTNAPFAKLDDAPLRPAALADFALSEDYLDDAPPVRSTNFLAAWGDDDPPMIGQTAARPVTPPHDTVTQTTQSGPQAPTIPTTASPEGGFSAIPIRGRGGESDGSAVIPLARRDSAGIPHVAPAPPATSANLREPVLAPVNPTAPVKPVGPASQTTPISADKSTDTDDAPVPAIGAAPATISRPGLPGFGNVKKTPIPERGGRTWFCRFCGMESTAPESCSWCHRDLRQIVPTANPGRVVKTSGKGKPPVPQKMDRTTVRTPVSSNKVTGRSMSGDDSSPTTSTAVKDLPRVNSRIADSPAMAATEAGSVPLGTFQAQKSRYYQDKVFDPVSQRHYDPDTGKVETPISDFELVIEETNDFKQLAIYLVLFTPLIVFAGSLTRMAHGAYLPVLLMATGLAAVLLPILRVAPFFSDDADDIGLAIFLTIALGPFAGLMVYMVVGVMKSAVNPAIMGIMISSLLLRIGIDWSIGSPVIEIFSKTLPNMDFTNWHVMIARLSPLAGIVGWLVADMFKKLDE